MLEQLRNFIEDEMMTDEEVREAVKESEANLTYTLDVFGEGFAPVFGGRKVLKELIKKGYEEYKKPVIGVNGVKQKGLFFTFPEV